MKTSKKTNIFELPIAKRLNLLVYLLLSVVFFIIYTGKLSHIPYHHEQHHLFLFSKSYFFNTVHSGGLLDYITNFIIQFFYYPWLGGLLFALLFASVYGLVACSARRLTGNIDFLHLGLLPVVYLFIQTLSVDDNISEIVALLIPLSVISVSVATFSSRLKYPVAVAGCLILLTFIHWKMIVAAAGIVSLSTMSAYFFRKLKDKHSLIITCLAMITYIGFGHYFFAKNFKEVEVYMTLIKKHVNEKKWTEAASLTERFFASGRKNILMLYYHNMALFHTGRLGDDMFNMPQTIGNTALCFTWRGNNRDTEYGYDAYYELGHWNAAQRWAFEAMVVWGETAWCLISLAECNIKIGRKAVAQKYINMLHQSLFYRAKAKELEKEVAAIPDKLETAPIQDEQKTNQTLYFSSKDDILWELELLCRHHPNNRMAFEYFMSALLLNNYVLDFAQNMYRIKAFDYKKMPRIYDEALLIYKMMEKEAFDKLGLNVSKETEARFQRYYGLLQQNNRPALKREFENTYWYYVHFVNPNGRDILPQPKYAELDIVQGGLEH